MWMLSTVGTCVMWIYPCFIWWLVRSGYNTGSRVMRTRAKQRACFYRPVTIYLDSTTTTQNLPICLFPHKPLFTFADMHRYLMCFYQLSWMTSFHRWPRTTDVNKKMAGCRKVATISVLIVSCSIPSNSENCLVVKGKPEFIMLWEKLPIRHCDFWLSANRMPVCFYRKFSGATTANTYCCRCCYAFLPWHCP